MSMISAVQQKDQSFLSIIESQVFGGQKCTSSIGKSTFGTPKLSIIQIRNVLALQGSLYLVHQLKLVRYFYCVIYSVYWISYCIVYTVEPLIKDTIEITPEQRTRFNVPNGDFPIVLILFLTSINQQRTKQWVPNVSVIRRFHCIDTLDVESGKGFILWEEDIHHVHHYHFLDF